MKKSLILLLVTFFCSLAANAGPSQRVHLGNGVYISTYGNVSVIEDENIHQSIQIKVQEKGDDAYDILCGNKIVRRVASFAIREGIRAAIDYFTAGQAELTGWHKFAIDVAVDAAYDAACNYFGKKR